MEKTFVEEPAEKCFAKDRTEIAFCEREHE